MKLTITTVQAYETSVDITNSYGDNHARVILSYRSENAVSIQKAAIALQTTVDKLVDDAVTDYIMRKQKEIP